MVFEGSNFPFPVTTPRKPARALRSTENPGSSAGKGRTMRRTVATLLVTSILSISAPSFARQSDPGGDWNPLKYIKKIVRLLLPSPTDGGDGLGPPKP